MKQGEDCSLLLKHSKGKMIATLQSIKPTSSSTSLSTSAKRKKRKGCKKKKLEKLLAYHQRLVDEKGLPPSRLMEEHAAASSLGKKKKFKCDQCDFESESQRGLKVHIGRNHKDTEVLREEHEVSLVLSEPGGDVARADEPASREETGEPTSPPQLHLPSSPLELPSACPGIFIEVGGGETGCGYCGRGWGKKCDWPWLKKQFRMTKEGLKAIEDD